MKCVIRGGGQGSRGARNVYNNISNNNIILFISNTTNVVGARNVTNTIIYDMFDIL